MENDTNENESSDQLPALDYCPICYCPGMNVGDNPPMGQFVTKRSLRASIRVWVECSWCRLRTEGKFTKEDASKAWNKRPAREYMESHRMKIIRSAKIALESLEYKDGEDSHRPISFELE